MNPSCQPPLRRCSCHPVRLSRRPRRGRQHRQVLRQLRPRCLSRLLSKRRGPTARHLRWYRSSPRRRLRHRRNRPRKHARFAQGLLLPRLNHPRQRRGNCLSLSTSNAQGMLTRSSFATSSPFLSKPVQRSSGASEEKNGCWIGMVRRRGGS